jgi:hypothetical protein
MTDKVYANRREILRAASLSGIALTTAAGSTVVAAEEPDTTCKEMPERVSVDDDELERAALALQSEFFAGIAVWRENKEIGDGDFEHGLWQRRRNLHKEILKRKWKLWQKCGTETMHCAYMAGLVVEGIRQGEYPDENPEEYSKITARQFNTAVQIVQNYQRDRQGAHFIGIVC